MKNLFTSLAILCLAIHGLKAQAVTKANQFGFGVFAGLNYTYPLVITRFPVHVKPQQNLLVGADIRYHVTDQSSLHLQPAWTQVNDLRSSDSWVHSTFSLSTIKLPVVYRYYVSPNRKLFFVQAGASYNYLIKSNYPERVDVQCIVAPCPALIGPDRPSSNKSAVSGLAGIGITIGLQKISIPVTLQYERYVSNYLFTGEFDTQPTRMKFESFSLTTGINF